MHNALTRLQNVFGFFTTVASVLAGVIAVLSLITIPGPPLSEGSLILRNVQVVEGRPHYYSKKKEEYAHVRFDLDLDLSSLFTWNTKQVFLYITATYPSPLNQPPTTAVVWDAILPHPLAPAHHNTYLHPGTKKSTPYRASNVTSTPGIIKLSNQRPKYQITDPTSKIAQRSDAKLELNYNIQPWVGALVWGTRKPGLAWWSTWRQIGGGKAVSESFDFPALKEKKEAAASAGVKGLDTERGAEGNKGKPA